MNNKGMRIFAILAVLLMLVSVLPIGALAAQDNGNGNEKRMNVANDKRVQIQMEDLDDDQAHDGDKEGDEDSESDEGEEQDRDKVRDRANVKDRYKDARDEFQKVKLQGSENAAASEDFVNATKDYLNNTIDYMIEHLEDVQERVEESGDESADAESDRIQEYMDSLEAEKENVADAETKQELGAIARSIRNIWADAQKDAKSSATKSVNNRINNFLDKAESVSLRIEDEINRLKDQGVDTTELEEMLEDYNELIAEANQNHELAKEAYQNNDAKETNKQLRETVQSLKEAGKVLNEMVKELKEHREGVVTLRGTGTLMADGDGHAVLSGNLTKLNLSAENATLVIKDLAGDASIEIDADYDFTNSENETDSTFSEDNNRALIFHGFDGNASINGSRLTVMIKGEGIVIDAEGTGKAILKGDGDYSIGDLSGLSWAKSLEDGDEIESEDEEENESEDESESEEESESEDESENEGDEEESESESESENESEDEDDSSTAGV